MARTAVSYSNLIANADIADPAGTSISSGAGNGGRIASAVPELTLIRLSNASGGSGTAKVLAGTNPPAIAAGQGDMANATIANGAARWLGPFESGRYLQNDGGLIVETSVAMTMTAFRIPRGT